MKKLVSIIVSAAIICSYTAVLADAADVSDKITVTMDGEPMSFDVEPIIKNGRVLVPFRKIFEELGCRVTYDEYNGKEFVTAARGRNLLSLEIGAYDMYVNQNTETLDTPAVIKDGRTLVPVRAVSEVFGADVKWISDSNTVAVTKKQGQHKINTVRADKDIKDESDTTLICISYAYPVIENNGSNTFIEQINNEYKAFAEKFAQEAESHTEDARLMLEEKGREDYFPIEFDLSYDVEADRKNILSVTNYVYYNLGGAHPNSARFSRTFDLENEKELSLSDIVNGNEDERHTMVYDVFIKCLEENYDGFPAETAERINEEADNVKFFLDDDALVLYFDVYQVGPYVMGYPTVELEYSEGLFKLDWSKDGADNADTPGESSAN